MKDRMFEGHYVFSPLGDDYRYSIFDITIARNNRPHKHEHVENGLDNYTINWELVATDDERRRGSDHLYLVNDTYYVRCSRTGMEKAGNTIYFSENTPDELRYEVVSAVFKGVLRRNSVKIKEGINKKDIERSDMTITGPRAFILSKECSQGELERYHDEMAELLVQTVDKYHNANSIGDIENIVEEYNRKDTELYRRYSNFEATKLSKVLHLAKEHNNWVYRKEIDKSERFAVIHFDEEIDDYFFIIEIVNDERISLVVDDFVDDKDYTIKEDEYESIRELENLLRKYLEYTPESPDVSEIIDS